MGTWRHALPDTSTDGQEPVEIDVNTDNLDDFNALFHGKAVAKPEVDEEVTPDAEDGVAPEQDEDEGADETAEEEVESEEDEEILKPKKNRKTAQERISELTAERHAAEREAQAERTARLDLERRLAQLEAGQKESEQKKPVVDPSAPHPMELDKEGNLKYPLGEWDPQYVVDLIYHTNEKASEQVRQKIEQEAQARQQEEAQTKLQTEWNTKLDTAEGEYDDLRPTIATLENEFKDLEPQYGVYLAQTIMSMDLGPQVLYYLAQNPKEARKIVAAGPMGATLALGRLEDRIERALKPKEKEVIVRVSKAPEPAVATRGVGSRNIIAGDTDDLDAFSKVFFKKK